MILRRISIALFLLVLLSGTLSAQNKEFVNPYVFELGVGVKTPLGETSNDVVTGLAFRLGMGYMLNKHVELAHLGIELGSSSPIDPEMLILQDWYSSYYGRMVMETVIIVGTPLTSRYHFNMNEYFDGFVGVGGAWYWFSTRLDDPYIGSIRKPRNRDGFGGIVEAGINTNLFSDNFLVNFTVDFSMLNTNGRTLSVKDERQLESNVSRIDQYLTFTIGMRYSFDK
ncbi:outer membrane beta-barrel protein [candidate division KSB1 bacterium]|nr:outer membrane beta-barrel protein [candidate division KSB1 bacterium]